MKKVKVLLVLLVITGVLSFISIYAGASVGYLNKTLSAYKSYVHFGTEYKIDRTVGQSYYNSGNVNNCTGNQNQINAKIVCVGQSISTKTLSQGQTGYWTENGAKICTRYNLQVRNNVYSPCQSTHSGVWTHN